MFIVDLDKLNLRELFQILQEGLCNGVQRPVRLTLSDQIHVRNTICNDQFAVPCETVAHQPKSLIPLNIPRTLEEFIQNRTHQIPRRRHKARHRDFIGQLAIDQSIVICKVNIDLCIQRGARGSRGTSWRWGKARGEGRRDRRRMARRICNRGSECRCP
jgi:hypothetical protein